MKGIINQHESAREERRKSKQKKSVIDKAFLWEREVFGTLRREICVRNCLRSLSSVNRSLGLGVYGGNFATEFCSGRFNFGSLFFEGWTVRSLQKIKILHLLSNFLTIPIREKWSTNFSVTFTFHQIGFIIISTASSIQLHNSLRINQKEVFFQNLKNFLQSVCQRTSLLEQHLWGFPGWFMWCL